MTDLTQTQQKTMFVSLPTKLILALVLLFVLAFIAIFSWMDRFVTGLAMRNLQTDLIATANAAAAGIDGDAHTALAESGQIDDATYTQIADYLRSVKRTNPQASGIYTYVHEDGTPLEQVQLVVSAALPPGVAPAKGTEVSAGGCVVVSSDRPALGQDYTDTSPTMIDGLKVAGAETSLWKDAWGSWLSGYAPILNSKNEPVGAVGVDMCAAEVIELQQSIRRNMAIALAVSLIMLAGVVWVIATGVTRPVLALTRVADRIGSGDYEQDFSSLHSSRVQDEVDKLASVFELMVSKVYTREQTLKARVQQLEIMIDQSRRDQEVQQIVESDFFQELQGKVNEMRSRFKREDE